MRTIGPLTVALLLLSGLSVAAQSADPLVATWEVNMAKSTYDPGPAPKRLSMVVTPDKDGYTIVQDMVTADGQAVHSVINLQPDGKPHDIQGRPGATVTTTRINARTYERVTRVNGKVTTTSRTIVAPDGKTRTTTTTGTNDQGQPVHEVIVYDRK
jgi:hypothetical protein